MTLIAIGGGKGGVGRTLLASGVAVFLAQLGKRVLIVDAHPCAPQHATLFGVAREEGNRPPWVIVPSEQGTRGATGAIPNVRVLLANTETGAVPGVTLRRPAEIHSLAGADATVFDLGDGTSSLGLDAMLGCESMVLVTTPEPTAIAAVYRWVRHAYARALIRQLKGRPADSDAVHAAVREAGGPPVPIRLADTLSRVAPTVADLAWTTLSRMRVRLVVNASRTRADLSLGEAMAVVANDHLGVSFTYLGHIEYDEAVVLAARAGRPLLVEAPGAKAARNIERIARRMLAVEPPRPERSTRAAMPPTHYEVLGLDRGASDEEVRKAYRRMREIYSAESLALASVLTEPALGAAVARVEQSRDVLLDPARRRPYDLSITPEQELRDLADKQLPSAVESAAIIPLPDLSAETEYTGALLRTVREARGMDLKDIAARTKIPLSRLAAIEAEEFALLPAAVYLRGFLVEVARALKLDGEQVVRTYLRRYRRVTEGSSRGRN